MDFWEGKSYYFGLNGVMSTFLYYPDYGESQQNNIAEFYGCVWAVLYSLVNISYV